MREIKFRLWDKRENKMNYPDFDEWHFDDEDNNIHFPLDTVGYITFRNKKDSILLQFTGVKDKNGKEIYECDIVKGVFGGIYEERIGVIIYGTEDIYPNTGAHEYAYATGFHVELKECFQGLDSGDKIEVIGNIYENPEMIKWNLSGDY